MYLRYDGLSVPLRLDHRGGGWANSPYSDIPIGGAIGFVLIFRDNFKLALLFILFLVVLQQLEGSLIYPRVVSSSVGLPGIWVFAAINIGGGLWGILGILFEVPAVASLYRLVSMDMAKRKKQTLKST